MRFTKDAAKDVMSGRKTQMRRPLSSRPIKRTRELPVQFAAKDTGRIVTLGRLRVLDVRREVLGEITYKDAVAEGHKSTGEFKVAYVRRHDAVWMKRELVELAAAFDDGNGCSVVDWMLVKRFDERHAHRLVEVVTFERVVETPRFMADRRVAADVAHDDQDYTTSASRAIDQLEVVDAAWQARFAERARVDSERRRAVLRAVHAKPKADRRPWVQAA